MAVELFTAEGTRVPDELVQPDGDGILYTGKDMFNLGRIVVDGVDLPVPAGMAMLPFCSVRLPRKASSLSAGPGKVAITATVIRNGAPVYAK